MQTESNLAYGRPLVAVLTVALLLGFALGPVRGARAQARFDEDAGLAPQPTPPPPAAPAEGNAADDAKAPAPPGEQCCETTPLAELPWYRRLTFRGAFGAGFSPSAYSMPTDYEVALGYQNASWLETGLFYRQESTRYTKDVFFPATGYTETRTYQLAATVVGLELMARTPLDWLSFVVAAGLSQTTSTPSGVTTTAPIPSSLPSDRRVSELYLGKRYGAQLDYSFGRFSVGAEIGVSSSSSSADIEIQQTYFSGVLTYRMGAPACECKPPQAAPAPAPTPAPVAPSEPPAPQPL